jgi:rare lipoprotein A
MVLVPLASLHHTQRTTRRTVVAAATPFDLAARKLPARASRSALRNTPDALASVIPVVDLETTTTASTTTTTEVPVRAAAVHHVTPATTRTTVRRRPTTTTTTRPKRTTTTAAAHTAAAAPSGPPKLRPFTAPGPASSTGQSESGQATWYETPDATFCAHKTLPIGTIITVKDTDNGKTTTCKVEDRGPYVDGRIVDLSPEAFSQLAPLSTGVINVTITW